MEKLSKGIVLKLYEDYDDLLDEEERKHITETEIDDYKDFDYIIKNTGIDELRKEASSIIKNEEM